MRFGLPLALASLTLAPGTAGAQPPPPDPAALQKKLTEFDGRIAALQREAADLRKQLDRLTPAKVVILTPPQAVEAYKSNPDRPVTVEFGVVEGTGAIYTGIGPDPRSFLVAVWGNPLPGGGSFKAIIHSTAFAELKIPSREPGKSAVKPPPEMQRAAVACHIDEHGVRVTGLVRKAPGPSFTDDYYIEVGDPSKVALFISVAPKALRQR